MVFRNRLYLGLETEALVMTPPRAAKGFRADGARAVSGRRLSTEQSTDR